MTLGQFAVQYDVAQFAILDSKLSQGLLRPPRPPQPNVSSVNPVERYSALYFSILCFSVIQDGILQNRKSLKRYVTLSLIELVSA